jgi:hypothetical protein
VAAGACWACRADDQSTRAFDWDLELLDAPQAWEIYQRQGEAVVIGVITAGGLHRLSAVSRRRIEYGRFVDLSGVDDGTVPDGR